MTILRTTTEKEIEAKSKINALAKALGYEKANILLVPNRPGERDLYRLSFKFNKIDQIELWDTMMCCQKNNNYLVAMEDLFFNDNNWSDVVDKMEKKTKKGYYLGMCNGIICVLKENETIEEALIRLDLTCK